jgi:hypothetical protein
MKIFAHILNEGYTKIQKQFHQLYKDVGEITQIISSSTLIDTKIDSHMRHDLRQYNICVSLNKNTVKLKENFKEFYSNLSKSLNELVRVDILI